MNDRKFDKIHSWYNDNPWNQPPGSLKLPVNGSNYMAVAEVTRHPRTSVQVANESGRANSQRNGAFANNPGSYHMYPSELQHQYDYQQLNNPQYTNNRNNQALPSMPSFSHQMYWTSSQNQHGYQQFYQRQIGHSQNNQACSSNPNVYGQMNNPNVYGQIYSSNAHPQHGYQQYKPQQNTSSRKNKAFTNNPDSSQMSSSDSQQQCNSQKVDKVHFDMMLHLKNLEIAAMEIKFELVNKQFETMKKENESMKKQLEDRKVDGPRVFYSHSSYMKMANRVTELEEMVDAWERDFAELEDRHVKLAKTTFGDPFAFKNKAVQTKDQSTSTEFQNEDNDTDKLEGAM